MRNEGKNQPASSDPGQTTARAGDRKLESWKAIARYLGRTVRTAHRWEKEEGLPVHRHLHAKQSSVYAFTMEIDAWLADRDVRSQQPGTAFKGRLTIVIAVTLVVGISLAAWLGNIDRHPAEAASVAVLPFQSLSTGPADRLLGYGIAEEVLNRLSTLPELTVLARATPFAFDDPGLDPVDAARRLGVTHLVTGSLQRDSGTARVQVRLLDRDGRQIWSRTFDRSSSALFDLQDDIARAVVDSVAPHLVVNPGSETAPDPEAYTLYLLGREHLRVNSRVAAQDAFEQAIVIAPRYAPPYGGLALVQALRSLQVMDRIEFETAHATALHALEISDELAEAHTALAILALEQGDLEEGETLLRRALELDPRLVEAELWLVTALQRLGRYAEAEQQLESVLRIDPLHPQVNVDLALQRWAQGDYEAAQRQLLRVLDLPNPPPIAYLQLVELNREFGRLVDAWQWAQQAALAYPLYTGMNVLIATYQQLDMPDEAARWYAHLVSAEAGRLPRLGIHSSYYFRLGDFEAAHDLKTEYIHRSGIALSSLPFTVQETFGGMLILTGRYDEGIAILEPWFHDEFELGHHVGFSWFPLTFAQFLVYGYQQTDRAADALRLLGRIDHHILALRDAGVGDQPNLYVVEARSQLLRGRPAGAVAALRLAVDSGWRDYVFERAIPFWDVLAGNADYESLLEWVRSDVASQRERVLADGASERFEQAVLGLVARPPQRSGGGLQSSSAAGDRADDHERFDP